VSLGPDSCLACGEAGRLSPAFTARDRSLHAVEGEFSYVRCDACGSVLQWPQPDEMQLAAAYAADYGNYQAEPSLLERVGEPLARREAARLVRAANPSTPLIELGCGTGRFLERARRSGWTGPIRGSEYDATTAESTSRRVGIPVDVGTVETTHFEDGSQGAIVLRHVIEHLRDPRQQVERLRAALRPDGVLYLATPDANALAASVFGDRWWGYEVPRHLVVFSADALTDLLEQSGFEVVDRWWNWAPQMWSGSLGLRLDGRPRREFWSRTANPLTLPVFGAAAAVEVATHRSTMFSIVARPR
jgi:SAM-dependent methyltransferase